VSFSEGFNSSLSLMLSLERTNLLKEEEELKQLEQNNERYEY